jgi:signal transduction histidine kinase/DNA-binding response OmpR family regulator
MVDHSIRHILPSRVWVFLSVAILFVAQQKVFCQTTIDNGFKYFINYSRDEYDYPPQNWCCLQDKRGIIYIANQGGLLEFDGVSWECINIPNKSVRSIAIDNSGIIYIGGRDEIGYLTPNKKSSLQYESLIKHLNRNQRVFGNVWSTYVTQKGTFFQTSPFLFQWKSRQLNLWKPKPQYRFNTSFTCNGKFFVHQRNVGIMHFVDDSLELIPGVEIIKASKIYMMVPYDEKKMLIGTRAKGFYIYDGDSLEQFPTEADDYLKEKQLYHGIRLTFSPGEFALATRLGGIAIIDSHGGLKYIFNNSNGLQDNSVKYVFEDFHGNLWLGLNKGITKIEYASPFSFYDDRSGLNGIVLSVTKHHNVLYTGTSSGLYSLSSNGKFYLVSRISSTCWSILSTGDSLLTATTHGIFQVGNKNKNFSKQRIVSHRSYILHRSKKDPNRIWVGTANGLVSLYWKHEKNQWEKESKFKDIAGAIRTIIEDQKGNLWIGFLTTGVLKVDLPEDGNSAHPIVKRYNKAHGLPDTAVKVFMVKDQVIFATEDGLFQFDAKEQIFAPDSTLGDRFAGGEKGRGVFRMVEDQNKNIWFHSELSNFHAIPRGDGSFIINEKPFLRLPHVQVNSIYPDPDGNTIWFASNDGLICYNKKIEKNYHLDFRTIIRKVLVNRRLIFGGYKTEVNDISYIGQPFPVIEYKDRNIRFQYAAPFFEGESETKYRSYLEGYETNWSDWTPETKKDYTNLDSGQYTFRVQAKNIYEHLSSEAVFQFKILPPWYKTWWAFSLYAIAAFFGVFLIVKWRSGKLEREKQRLEQIVKERTKEIEERTIEINEKNIQLESQTVQLKEQSEKLKEMDEIKSRFFANISHEFRTPLTLLMGPLEQMISVCSENAKEKKRKLTLMLRNAQRLLRLINQLLELSKLDSGKMKLQAEKTNIISFLKGIIDSFRFMAQQKELELVFYPETELEDITLYIDPRKMEDVMSNLLVNAFKFTPPGGKITVTINKSFCGEPGDGFLEKNPPMLHGAEGKNIFPEGYVEISVSDTGHGIPAEQLVHIFDRFYQADATYEYHEKGSGIGLALSKELVELHHGTIEARSREGEGSAFIIRLPLGSEHLAPGEIVDLPEAQTRPPTDNKISEKITAIESGIEKEEKETEPQTILEPEDKTNETNIILVVEDSADMRAYIRGALEPAYTVIDAKDGREGIEKAKVIIPDLIISDIMMPEVDGYELCSVLKNDVKTSHIPIIMLTAKASEENILQGLETGADDYITKPFNTKILMARIKNLIDIRGQLQKNINRQMTLQPVKTSVSKIDQAFFRDLHEVINKNLSDEEFNVEQLCKKLYMGRTTLYRKVLALTGETPTDFIRSYRLKRGAELLKQNFGTVLEVAFEVGFSNSSYFAKCFKEKFHQLPSEYQAANKQ